MDRRRCDQPAITRGFGVGLVEIDRMGLADRFAVEFDRLPGQRVGNGRARRAGDDVVPDLAQIGVFPEIGLEGFRLRHLNPPSPALSRNLLYGTNFFLFGQRMSWNKTLRSSQNSSQEYGCSLRSQSDGQLDVQVRVVFYGRDYI